MRSRKCEMLTIKLHEPLPPVHPQSIDNLLSRYSSIFLLSLFLFSFLHHEVHLTKVHLPLETKSSTASISAHGPSRLCFTLKIECTRKKAIDEKEKGLSRSRYQVCS